MSKIENMNQLRARVLKAFEDLENGEIDLEKASALAKLNETIVSGLKSEMQYAILTNQQPHIPFYGKQSGIELNHETIIKTKKLK